MTANADEPDAPFRDQPPGEALGSAEQLGDLGHSHVALDRDPTLTRHHAAFPVAERLPSGS
jgi:hypothetical protein